MKITNIDKSALFAWAMMLKNDGACLIERASIKGPVPMTIEDAGLTLRRDGPINRRGWIPYQCTPESMAMIRHHFDKKKSASPGRTDA